MAVILAAVLMSESADASGRHRHHGRIGLGFYFGAPYYPPYYGPYYHPRYYYPPVYVAPPVTYIERDPYAAPSSAPQGSPAAPAMPQYWFFCRESNAYYPHVGQCAGGWERVTPQPQS